MSTVMEYSPLSVGIAYLPFCAVLVVALAASAPLVTRHGHRPAACTVLRSPPRNWLLSRVAAHDADALDLVPAMVLVPWPRSWPPGPASAGLAVLTTLVFRRAASAISAGIPDQTAAAAGVPARRARLAAGAALVLLMTDHDLAAPGAPAPPPGYRP